MRKSSRRYRYGQFKNRINKSYLYFIVKQNLVYHMNKEHWNTIILSDKCDRELVEELLEQSYDLTKK